MFIALMAYISSAGWPTLGHDSQRSSYQSVSGAEISAPSVKWRVPVTQILQRSCGPVLSDVRADYPGCEVLFNDGKYLKCLDGNTGNQIWSFALPDSDISPNSIAVGDIDGDSCSEIVLLGSGGSSVGNSITALDGPGSGCWAGVQGEERVRPPSLLARPGKGILYLSVQGLDGAEATIWDASGRRLEEVILTREPRKVTLGPGVYFVEARCGDVILRGKAPVY
ncbi:MAG: hypothetical protein ABIM19_09765 [candidate division WOR-3 bacterium]